MKEWINFFKGSPGADLFNIHTLGDWTEMAGNYPYTNIGGQTFNTPLLPAFVRPLHTQSIIRLYTLRSHVSRPSWLTVQ